MDFMFEVMRFIQSFANPVLDKFFLGITMLGDETVSMVVIAVIFWCINKELGYRLGFAYLTNGVLNTGLKEIFHIPRPIGQPGIRVLAEQTAPGYSFPSGHTQLFTSFWTSLMVYVRKKWLSFLGMLMIFLMALSRVYLGVHTPMDVLGGMVIGVLWVLFSNLIFDYVEKTGNLMIVLLIILPILLGLFVFHDFTYYKLAGTAMSVWIGYMIERKYIQFDSHQSFGKQVLKFIIGFTVLMVLRITIKRILPVSLFSDLIRYFIIGLWLIAGAPYVFQLLFKKERQNYYSKFNKPL